MLREAVGIAQILNPHVVLSCLPETKHACILLW
jgi:hypothetical protein